MVTARIAGLSPGTSPPPVRIPITPFLVLMRPLCCFPDKKTSSNASSMQKENRRKRLDVQGVSADLWPLTSGSAYSTLTSLQRKRYLFVCINRRAEENPKGCCALKDSEEVYRALKGEVAARGLAKLEARVCSSSCLDQCATGVTVLVEPDHFFYGRVTVADVPEIVDGLVKGQPVKRLVITADQHNGAGWDQRHRR